MGIFQITERLKKYIAIKTFAGQGSLYYCMKVSEKLKCLIPVYDLKSVFMPPPCKAVLQAVYNMLLI